MKHLLILCVLLTVPALTAARDTLVVDIQDIKPLVYTDHPEPTGFDIELFEQVARIAELPPYHYNTVSSFHEILPRAACGKSDMAICGITIRSDREEYVDFSYPYFKSGLAMLVRDEKETGILAALRTYLNVIIRLIPLFIGYAIYLVGASFLIMWFERGNEMFPHFFDAAYWVNTVISSTGFGDKTAVSRKGKVLAQILMFTGIGFLFPMLTGTVTAELSAQRQEYAIKGPSELRGQKVAVKEGTTSAAAVKKYGGILIPVSDMNQAAAMLITEQVDVVVQDYPSVKYLSKTIPGLVALKEIFEPQDYGIILQQGSPYREAINKAILTLMEDGTYSTLYEKYFGDKD